MIPVDVDVAEFGLELHHLNHLINNLGGVCDREIRDKFAFLNQTAIQEVPDIAP